MLVHLIILPTLLTGLRGRALEALGRVCFMRASTCDTLKGGVSAGVTLRLAGGGGTSVVPRRVAASTPAAVKHVGTHQQEIHLLPGATGAPETPVTPETNCET